MNKEERKEKTGPFYLRTGKNIVGKPNPIFYLKIPNLFFSSNKIENVIRI